MYVDSRHSEKMAANILTIIVVQDGRAHGFAGRSEDSTRDIRFCWAW